MKCQGMAGCLFTDIAGPDHHSESYAELARHPMTSLNYMLAPDANQWEPCPEPELKESAPVEKKCRKR